MKYKCKHCVFYKYCCIVIMYIKLSASLPNEKGDVEQPAENKQASVESNSFSRLKRSFCSAFNKDQEADRTQPNTPEQKSKRRYSLIKIFY